MAGRRDPRAPGVVNEAQLRVRSTAMLGPVLGRVTGMLAARANCPIDRLDDAMLLTDAVTAHAPAVSGEFLDILLRTEDGFLELRVRDLGGDGAQRLLDSADLDGVGNVFEHVATTATVNVERGELVLRLDCTS